MAITKEEILEYLEAATILELNDLIKAIEEKFDVTAAAPMAVAAPVDDEPQGPVNVTVTLTEVGPTKVQVIKAVKEITGLGLVPAKKLVDALPAKIKEDIPAEEAAKIKEQLEAVGASVTVA